MSSSTYAAPDQVFYRVIRATDRKFMADNDTGRGWSVDKGTTWTKEHLYKLLRVLVGLKHGIEYYRKAPSTPERLTYAQKLEDEWKTLIVCEYSFTSQTGTAQSYTGADFLALHE